MAAYYDLKILHNEGYKFNQRFRLIVGTDEESDWQCTDAYFKSEEMPDAGFAPDAAFPLIHGEKGITTFNIIQQQTSLDDEEPNRSEEHTSELQSRGQLVRRLLLEKTK